MDSWTPTQQLAAQYAVAFLAAFVSLMASSKTITPRRVIGDTGKFGLLGGVCAPIMAGIVPMPVVVGKMEKVLFWCVAIATSVITVPMLRAWVLKLATTNGKQNAGDPEAGD